MDRREAIKRAGMLTGFSLSASATLGFLNGCSPTGKPSWPTRFLTDEEVSLVSAIAEMILPATETLGALDVHVPEFIDLMLNDNFTSEEQQTFRKGAAEFQKIADDNYSNLFEKCAEEEKAKIIKDEEQRSLTEFQNNFHRSFYLMVKELTILGYYTSEYVMTNVLDHHPVPGRYDGCIPFGQEGKLYVDNNV
jgi:gluconate 2-dehydrogenase gamma chain